MRYLDACRDAAWHLKVWPKGEPSSVRVVPYRCRSWRHAGNCCLWKGAQDFVRIRDALASKPGWVYVVLTYRQSAWPNPTVLYRAGVAHWSALRQRIQRRYGKLAYVQTWERHQSGFPHVNVTIHNPAFFRSACDDWRGLRAIVEEMAVAVGFGFRVWLEPLKDRDAMAGYLVKLARELTGAGAKDQTPTNAPRHFRRLRASRGLLPPPHKNPAMTGELVRAPKPAELVLDDGEVISVH